MPPPRAPKVPPKELRRVVLGDDADLPVAAYDCEDRLPDWRDIADELATASLFGGGSPRLVILERADAFVSANRPKLEDYVAKPRASGVLILEVDEWPANTRLYKAIDQSGLQRLLYDVETSIPFLFVDQLVVQVPASIAASGDGKLRILLAVSGQWQGAK